MHYLKHRFKPGDKIHYVRPAYPAASLLSDVIRNVITGEVTHMFIKSSPPKDKDQDITTSVTYNIKFNSTTIGDLHGVAEEQIFATKAEALGIVIEDIENRKKKAEEDFSKLNGNLDNLLQEVRLCKKEEEKTSC